MKIAFLSAILTSIPVCFFIYFYEYLLNVYYVSDIVEGTWYMVVNKNITGSSGFVQLKWEIQKLSKWVPKHINNNIVIDAIKENKSNCERIF